MRMRREPSAVDCTRPLMAFGVNEYHSVDATQSLKTKYLMLALGVGAALSLLLGGFAYYEHRIDAADANDLTLTTTVAQKLEGGPRVARQQPSARSPARCSRRPWGRATGPRSRRSPDGCSRNATSARRGRGLARRGAVHRRKSAGVSAAPDGPLVVSSDIRADCAAAAWNPMDESRERCRRRWRACEPQLEHQQGNQFRAHARHARGHHPAAGGARL